MQTELLNNIPVADLYESKIANEETIGYICNNFFHVENNEIDGHSILSFIERLESYIPNLAVKVEDGETIYDSSTLRIFCRLFIHLIEETDWLMGLPQNEADKIRKEVGESYTQLRVHAKVADMLSGKAEQNAEEFLEQFLTKIQKTAYLHEKEKICNRVRTLLKLKPELMDDKMPQMVDIILQRNQSDWQGSDLREEIVIMLDLYIEHLSSKLNWSASIDGKIANEQLRNCICSIGMQLLLYKEGDPISFARNRAILYRLASYISDKSDTCLSNAYLSLIDGMKDPRLEFIWLHLQSHTLMASVLSVEKEAKLGVKRCFDNGQQKVILSPTNVFVSPTTADKNKLKSVVPSTFGMWKGLQVMLEATPNNKVTKGSVELMPYRHWWNEVENTLFRERKAKSDNRSLKRRPAIGEQVSIVVDGILDATNSIFHCTIHDPCFEGDGTLDLHDVASYNIRPSDLNYILNSGFCDSETGIPYLFDAYVTGERGAMLTFGMSDYIEEAWSKSPDCAPGEQVEAVVTFIHPNNSLEGICVTALGISMQVHSEDVDMHQGDIILTRILGTKKSKHGLQLDGEYIQPYSDPVTQQDGLVYLLNFYSEGVHYKPEQEIALVEKEEILPELDDAYMQELVRILDRKALLHGDIVQRYHFLETAKIFARMLNEQDQVEYYDNSQKQQLILQDFAHNKRVDFEQLASLEQKQEMFTPFPALMLRLNELKVLHSLGQNEDINKLLNILELSTDRELSQLCHLVLAYNHLSGFEMPGQKKEILDKISELLDITLDVQEAEYIGEESEKCEFKTSVVFVANAEHQIKEEPKTQMQEILREVCSFLNTKGGDLYIGVNNFGYAVGVADDIEWFRRNPYQGHCTDADSYMQYVTNAIFRTWKDLNTLISITHHATKNNRFYIKVSVMPSLQPYTLDGEYYHRVGTETRRVTKDGEKEFLKRRPLQYESIKK